MKRDFALLYTPLITRPCILIPIKDDSSLLNRTLFYGGKILRKMLRITVLYSTYSYRISDKGRP